MRERFAKVAAAKAEENRAARDACKLGQQKDLQQPAIKKTDMCSQGAPPELTDQHVLLHGSPVMLGKLLGQGAYGKVFAGTIKGTGVPTLGVKVPQKLRQREDCQGVGVDSSPSAFQDIAQEFTYLYHLSKCPFIVRTFGIVAGSSGVTGLALELAQGSLLTALNEKQLVISGRAVLVQVLHGLQYIHSRHVLHGDLKPGNILSFAGGRVALSDFGLAKTLQNGRISVQGNQIYSLGYRCPECLHARKKQA